MDLAFLFYGAVFLTTLLLVESVYFYVRDVRSARRRANKRLQMIASGIDRRQLVSLLRRRKRPPLGIGIADVMLDKLDVRIAQAGLSVSAERFVLAAAVGTLGLFAMTLVLRVGDGPVLAGLFALSLGIGGPHLVLGRMRDRRLKKLGEQFPVALDVFVRGLRAGYPVASALEMLTNEMPDPAGTEFGLVADEVAYGLDLRTALQNFADRVGFEDARMFVVSVAIQSETGGNLAEILENLSRVIRDRASLVMKVRALSSEGRASGIALSVLPVATFALVYTLNPGFYTDVSDDPIFLPVLGFALMLYVLGVYTMRRMINFKV